MVSEREIVSHLPSDPILQPVNPLDGQVSLQGQTSNGENGDANSPARPSDSEEEMQKQASQMAEEQVMEEKGGGGSMPTDEEAQSVPDLEPVTTSHTGDNAADNPVVRRHTVVRPFLGGIESDTRLERIHLTDEIFPQLDALAAQQGIRFFPQNNCWGHAKKQRKSDHALQLSLDSIDSARPFFMSIIGSAYGEYRGPPSGIESPPPTWSSLNRHQL